MIFLSSLVVAIMFEVPLELPTENMQRECNKSIHSVISEKKANRLQKKGVVLGCAYSGVPVKKQRSKWDLGSEIGHLPR